MNNFTDAEQAVIDQQGWNNDSLVTLLTGYDAARDGVLVDYLKRAADAENEVSDVVVVDFDLDHDGKYHRVQVDGSDLISIEDQHDGTAFVIVFASSAEDADPVWSGAVRVDGHFTTPKAGA